MRLICRQKPARSLISDFITNADIRQNKRVFRILWIETPVNLEEKAEKLRNLHVYDYNLFWMNIRQNVKQRIDSFLKHSP